MRQIAPVFRRRVRLHMFIRLEGGGYEWTENSMLALAVENITDEDYRVHGSGVNGPGRNFILSY